MFINYKLKPQIWQPIRTMVFNNSPLVIKTRDIKELRDSLSMVVKMFSSNSKVRTITITLQDATKLQEAAATIADEIEEILKDFPSLQQDNENEDSYDSEDDVETDMEDEQEI